MSKFQNFKKQHLNVQNLALIACLLAIQIILSRFLSISTPIMKIGFSFIPVAIAARKLGTFESMTVAGLGDLIGAILFPIGPYFPGFTLSAMITGLINGLSYHKKCNIKRVVFAVLLGQLVSSILLNTLWISLLYGSDFLVLLPTRLIQAGIMCTVEIVILQLLFVGDKKLIALKAN